MTDDIKLHEATCKTDLETLSGYRETIPEIAEQIIASCNEEECYTHIDFEPIPSKESLVEIITRLQETL
ncbi:MAG TPA: hypothetical protein ENI07_04190, partial [Desulfobacterales bacterium]|nr:hypothetical protein [Desulfobacterales bacterium]